ncbi:hypothetical protein FUT87_05280 [Mitsuaria sp. TWR114]|uniref:hypothetical protein n=1 Tax=Mitsuaria sp. TWR114 TaxID=2601731 RepID=UPI0011BF3380|nr:hypothetical protein [Mitsuaria sp. TWR114]TXD97235.1 hypothetical protein FUT87_05280 [Mitsuaria sp. TWR114]
MHADSAAVAAARAGEGQAPLAPTRKKGYFLANVATVLALAVGAAATWITAMALVEAYGIGPDNFGQAVQAARREAPGVGLYLLDAGALAVVAVLSWLAARGYRSGR